MKRIKQRRIAQLRLVMQAKARRYGQVAKWRAAVKKARAAGRAPVPRPSALKDPRAYARKVKLALRRRYRYMKQRMRQRNSRSGGCGLRSNVRMYRPAFLRFGRSRKLAIQNFAEDPITGRRRLVGLSELDVSRDVMDFNFITDSDQESEPVEYFLEMKKWDENGLDVKV